MSGSYIAPLCALFSDAGTLDYRNYDVLVVYLAEGLRITECVFTRHLGGAVGGAVIDDDNFQLRHKVFVNHTIALRILFVQDAGIQALVDIRLNLIHGDYYCKEFLHTKNTSGL